MKLAKWGNSLAIRIPFHLVQREKLKEGDTVEVVFRDDRVLELSRDRAKLEALERIRKLRRPLPPGYQFNREEVHDRDLTRRQALELREPQREQVDG